MIDIILALFNTYGVLGILFIVLGVILVIKKAGSVLIALFWFMAGCLITIAFVKGLIPVEVLNFGGFH